MKGQRSTWPLVLILNQRLIRFNIYRKFFDFRLNSYRKMNISRFPNINAFGIIFDLVVQKVKVIPDS